MPTLVQNLLHKRNHISEKIKSFIKHNHCRNTLFKVTTVFQLIKKIINLKFLDQRSKNNKLINSSRTHDEETERNPVVCMRAYRPRHQHTDTEYKNINTMQLDS